MLPISLGVRSRWSQIATYSGPHNKTDSYINPIIFWSMFFSRTEESSPESFINKQI